jgi:hypothetical protein
MGLLTEIEANLIVAVIIIIVTYVWTMREEKKIYSEIDISAATDAWLVELYIQKNASARFCSDGTLTVKGEVVPAGKYFAELVELPGLRAIRRNYKITKISSDVWLNEAFVTYFHDDLQKPKLDHILFWYRDGCIFKMIVV